jgi:Domain of unknown function (DUF1083).
MKKFITAVLCTIFILSLGILPAAAVPDVFIEAYEADITVDGKRDDGYVNGTTIAIPGVATMVDDVTTGELWIAYDKDHLYFYIEIDDSTPFAESTTDWQNDGIEYFIDLLNEREESYTPDCIRIRVMAAIPPVGNDNFGSNMTFVNAEDSEVVSIVVPKNGTDWKDGYVVEVAYKSVYANKEGMKMGFEAQITDDRTGSGERESQAFLSNGDDTAWSTPSTHGAEIVFMGEPPVSLSILEPAALEETPAYAAPVEATTPAILAPSTNDGIIALINILSVALVCACVVIKKRAAQ